MNEKHTHTPFVEGSTQAHRTRLQNFQDISRKNGVDFRLYLHTKSILNSARTSLYYTILQILRINQRMWWWWSWYSHITIRSSFSWNLARCHDGVSSHKCLAARGPTKDTYDPFDWHDTCSKSLEGSLPSYRSLAYRSPAGNTTTVYHPYEGTNVYYIDGRSDTSSTMSLNIRNV